MRISGSVILAGVIAVAAVGWIASGQLGEKPATASTPPAPSAAPDGAPNEPSVPRVRVRDLSPSDFVASVISSGQTEAARVVTVRAETSGRIVATPTGKGARVDTDAVIVEIDRADRPAGLAEAKARIAQREMEYNAASKLAAKGFQAETTLAGARAELEAAKAERRRIEVDLARTRIAAPLRGVLHDRSVEIGDYVGIGDPVAVVVELDPLLITAQVAERQAPLIAVGMPADARLSSGDRLTGVVRYVAAVADEDTRTFRVEIEIDNSDYRYGQGLTSEIRIDLPAVRAHPVSPSIFRLDERGRIGVMTVDADNHARFAPVDIVGVDDRGTWVRGLPSAARIIVVGQDLVDDGETVDPVPTQTAGATQ